jgi:hypothetical protein
VWKFTPGADVPVELPFERSGIARGITVDATGAVYVDDPRLALAVAGGALMGLGKLVQDEPERDDALAADHVTADVLRLFGVPPEEADELCRRPLPAIETLPRPGSAA